MTINLNVPELSELKPRITVFGVGGAGGNAVANMMKSNLGGVEFVVANTDAQALAQSPCERRIQMGASVTQGLGAGSRPEMGRAAAEEALTDITDHLSGCHMVFITAGMGGGTGTGAAPIIARFAKDQDILTVGVVTKPFQFEGPKRMRVADAGIEEFQKYTDTLLVIPNQNLFRVANDHTTFAEAFAMADEVLHSGVRGITDLMVMPGLVNLDFNDIKAVMGEMGKAMMGTGEAEGEKRALDAAEAAISNPLLDEVSMKGARGVLINVTGGPDLGLYEVDEVAHRILSEVDSEANVIWGTTCDQNLEGRVRVSVVATGIDADENVVSFSQKTGAIPTNGGSSVIAGRESASTSSVVSITDAVSGEPAGEQPMVVNSVTGIGPRQSESPAVTPQVCPSEQAAPVMPRTAGEEKVSSDPTAPSGANLEGRAVNDGDSSSETEAVGIAPSAKQKSKKGVINRIMASVKSARQVNRTGQESRATPPSVTDDPKVYRSSHSPALTANPSSVSEEPEEERLSPVTGDEEQLEIPAFLRRQAN